MSISLSIVHIHVSKIGVNLEIHAHDITYHSTIVEKPFYDPKKKIASS